MINLTFWDKQSPLTLISGKTYSSDEIKERHPVTIAGKTVLEVTVSGIVSAIDSLDVLRQVYNITTPDDDEALVEIIAIRNAPPAKPEPLPSELMEALRILTGGADDELDDIISSNRT